MQHVYRSPTGHFTCGGAGALGGSTIFYWLRNSHELPEWGKRVGAMQRHKFLAEVAEVPEITHFDPVTSGPSFHMFDRLVIGGFPTSALDNPWLLIDSPRASLSAPKCTRSAKPPAGLFVNVGIIG